MRLYGPNGFYRECRGSRQDPPLNVACSYEYDLKGKVTGNLVLVLFGTTDSKAKAVEIKDNSYGNKTIQRELAKAGKQRIVLPLEKSHGWYDFSVTVPGQPQFEQRFAGRVETGRESITDPLMGGVAG